MSQIFNTTPLLNLACILMLCGCSNAFWPEHGRGGVAEDYPHRIHWEIEREEIERMRTDLKKIRYDIRTLNHMKIKTYMPATLHDIEMQLALAEREFNGAFYRNAEVTLRILKGLITNAFEKIEKHQT